LLQDFVFKFISQSLDVAVIVVQARQFARGAKYLEQSFAADPGNEFGLRMLMRVYLDMDDRDEAEAVAKAAPHAVGARDLSVLLYRHDWLGAGERAYDSARRLTSEAIDDHLRLGLMAALDTLPVDLRPKVVLHGEAPIPRTHTGKIQRRKLQALFAKFAEHKGPVHLERV